MAHGYIARSKSRNRSDRFAREHIGLDLGEGGDRVTAPVVPGPARDLGPQIVGGRERNDRHDLRQPRAASEERETETETDGDE